MDDRVLGEIHLDHTDVNILWSFKLRLVDDLDQTLLVGVVVALFTAKLPVSLSRDVLQVNVETLTLEPEDA